MHKLSKIFNYQKKDNLYSKFRGRSSLKVAWTYYKKRKDELTRKVKEVKLYKIN